MSIKTILILILYTQMEVISIDWTPKNRNNGIILVQRHSIFASFATHSKTYEIDLTQLSKITGDIYSHINRIEKDCTISNDITCNKIVNTLKSHASTLAEKTLLFFNLEQNYGKKRAKKELNIQKAAKDVIEKIDGLVDRVYNVSKSEEKANERIEKLENYANSTVSTMNNNLAVEICMWEIMNYERKIIDIQSFIIENDVINLLRIVNYTELCMDISENALRNKTLNSITDEGTCKNIFVSNKITSGLLKMSKISSKILDSKLIIEVETPILEPNVFKLYKVIKTPITIHDETLIVNNLPDNIILGCNTSVIDISDNKLDTSHQIIDGHQLISLNKNERIQNNCARAMLIRNFTENDYVKCGFSNILHTNYIIKLTDNFYFIHTIKPVDILKICKNSTINTMNSVKSSGILELETGCKYKIEQFEIMANSEYEQKEIISTEYALNDTISNHHEAIENPQIFLKTDSIIIDDAKNEFDKIKTTADTILNNNGIYVKIEKNNANQIQIIILCGIMSAIGSMICTGLLLLIFYIKLTNTNQQLKIASKLIRSLNKLE